MNKLECGPQVGTLTRKKLATAVCAADLLYSRFVRDLPGFEHFHALVSQLRQAVDLKFSDGKRLQYE